MAKRKPFRMIGVDTATKCKLTDDGAGNVTYGIILKGKALKLSGFGYPVHSVYGKVKDEVLPIPVNGSGVGMEDATHTDCQPDADGNWCIIVPFDDPNFVSGDEVSLTLWHYYQNKIDVHVTVEVCKITFTVPDPGDIVDCDCGCP
jgi:hypothetical protein